jgi:hypothetical protein
MVGILKSWTDLAAKFRGFGGGLLLFDQFLKVIELKSWKNPSARSANRKISVLKKYFKSGGCLKIRSICSI